MTTPPLVSQRELEALLRRLAALEKRVGTIEVTEKLNYTPQTSYTPTYLGGTTAGVTTYTLQVGSYLQLGGLIVARGQVVWTASTGTGNAQVSLPVAPTTGNYSGSLRLSAVTFANSAPELTLSAGNAFFTMDSPLTNAAPTAVAMEAAGNIVWTVAYFA